jgi:hypothetical protein
VSLGVTLVLFLSLIDRGGDRPRRSEAHEERLMVGRVERIEPTRGILTVGDARSGERRQIEITPETEVIICQTRAPLAAVWTGARVRVKYLDRRGGEPEAQSIFLIGRPRASLLAGDRVAGATTRVGSTDTNVAQGGSR